MLTTIVMTEEIAAEIRELTMLEVETGAVLLASIVHSEDGHNLRLLARKLRLVPDKAYQRREALRLDITSDGYVPALGEAEREGLVPLWVHTHPGEDVAPDPSESDEQVDGQLSDLFRLRSGCEYYGSLIFSTTQDRLLFTGHLEDDSGTAPIHRLMVAGSHFMLQLNNDLDRDPIPALFDRNIRAFGDDLQSILRELRIAVVGCGGTGSSVAEQLVRMGVRHLQLVDPDTVSTSNITRMYGSKPSDVGRPKVEALAEHLAHIATDLNVRAIQSTSLIHATARMLAEADIIFGCTDDNAGRLVLSRLSTYMMIPVIDCGVILTSDGDQLIEGIHGRVTVLHPGAACLMCRRRIDVARAGSEMLTPEERVRRVDEGYAPALGNVEPSVVPFTTLVAAAAVCELLERFIGYGPEPVPSEILFRLHDREMSTNLQAPRSRCYCDPESGKIGLGVTSPLLERVWQ